MRDAACVPRCAACGCEIRHGTLLRETTDGRVICWTRCVRFYPDGVVAKDSLRPREGEALTTEPSSRLESPEGVTAGHVGDGRRSEGRARGAAPGDSAWQPCWKCGEPLTPENAPRVEGGIQCESCLTVWAVPEEVESDV